MTLFTFLLLSFNIHFRVSESSDEQIAGYTLILLGPRIAAYTVLQLTCEISYLFF